MNKHNIAKQGYMLIISLIVLALLSAGALLLLRMSSQRVFLEKKRANRVRAKLLAESGVHRTFSLLQDDPTLINTTFEPVQMDGGSYNITIMEKAAGEGAGNTILLATGTYHGVSCEAAIAMESTSTETPSTPDEEETTDSAALELFDGVMFCGKDATMTGNAYIDLQGAVAHVNGTISMKGSASFKTGGLVSSSTEVDMSGGNAKIYGDVAAPSIPLPSWAKWQASDYFITGTQSIMDVPEQMIEIDLLPFYEYTLLNNTSGNNYKSSKMVWNQAITDSYISADELQAGKLNLGGHQILRPAGGVVWVEGDVDLGGSSIVEGCIIATGDIKIAGGMTQINPNGLPSYMSTDGDIDLVSGCTAYGLLYAHNGDIKIAGDATVEGGAFIAPRGSFTHNGSGKIHYANSHPYGPEGEEVTIPKPTTGTDGSSTIDPPKYMGWIK